MFKAPIRSFSVAVKELSEIRRQPRLIASLILGPFIILLLFGLGYSVAQPPIHTVVVVQPGSPITTRIGDLKNQFPYPFILEDITGDESEARQLVEDGKMDVAVILPPDPQSQVMNGHQATVHLYYKQLDPVYGSWIPYFGQSLVEHLNQQILQSQVEQLQGRVRQTDPNNRLANIPAGVLTSPLKLQTKNFVPHQTRLIDFYGPAVLALLLQHIAITLSSLSVVREKQLGAMELYRVTPVSIPELFIGKYLGYGLITLAVGAILTALMYFGLNIPLYGSLAAFAASLIVLILGSLSVGLLISTLSKTDSQSVQLSMLVLLASIFFSGFFLPLSTLTNYVKVITYILPVTYGISSLKQIMLLGEMPAWRTFGAPLAIWLIALVIAGILLSRALKRS